ncbi:MAG: hypothetical protein K9L68_11710, partial [Spirochaetales bacterium]|nr:hypothetical protein [Spirochaetales bacterium]MCF7939255.1 hypothetical protein [Spirochaetales bacterium]
MMKQEQKRHSILGQRAYSTTTGLIVLLLIYSLLTVLVLVFARQILSDLSLSRQFSGYLLIPMGIVLPVFLIGALVVNVIRLRRERRAGDPGVKLKVKLIVFFVFISILSALPQALLSFNFIRSALFSWYSGDTSQALDAGLRSALEVYQGGLERLRTLNDSPLYTRMLESYRDRPQQLWNTIQNTGAGIGSLQLFGPSGREREFFGDQAARIEGKPEIRSEGLMPKASRAGRSVIRAIRFLPPAAGGGDTGYAVLGIVLPEGFDQDARMLTEASERFQQIGEFRGLFQIVIFLLYSFFALPILLIAVLSSFLL